MNTEPKQQLRLYFAAENDTAVILRRGASKLWQLIGWDRATDTFEPGQWIKRRVIPESCALSPDGRFLMYSVYSGRDHAEMGEVYTVVSRPPYFTALALFPYHYSWNGHGGRFLGNGHFLIGTSHENLCKPVPELAQVVRGAVTKDCRTGLRLLNGEPAPLTRALREELLEGTMSPRQDFLDRYDTQGGRLYRRRGLELDPIADFGLPVFEPIVAPYARTERIDAADSDWHPLDGEHP